MLNQAEIKFKIEEIIGEIGVRDVEAYSRECLNGANPLLIKKLQEFSSADVLDYFFDSEAIRIFSAEQQAILQRFKVVLYSTTEKGVYSYTHKQDEGAFERQKLVVEFSLASLYALFNFALFFRRMTVPNPQSVGECKGIGLLKALSGDKDSDLAHINVEFVPPPAQNYYEKSLIKNIMKYPLKINPNSLVFATGHAPVLPILHPTVQQVLVGLKFYVLVNKISSAVAYAGQHYANTENEFKK